MIIGKLQLKDSIKVIPNDSILDVYQVRAVTEGIDSQATVTVRLKKNNRIFSASNANNDVLKASALAYLGCLEKVKNYTTTK